MNSPAKYTYFILIAMLIVHWFDTRHMGKIMVQISSLEKRLNQVPQLASMKEEEVRKLDGRLAADRTGNIMYFRSFTVAKGPSGESFRVPIGSLTNVFRAIQSNITALGPGYIPMTVVPEMGIYEGKLALMGAVVTLILPPNGF